MEGCRATKAMEPIRKLGNVNQKYCINVLWKYRGMDIETTVSGAIEDSWRHKQTERDGNYEVDGPVGENWGLNR
jgi:hypothetical protein